MGAEPSALGARLRFNTQRVPDVEPLPFAIHELERLTRPDPATDGFMALCLYRYRRLKRRIVDAGFCVPVVSARGPLTIASFLRGVNDLMTDLVDEPERTLRLLDVTTELAIGWLRAQIEALEGGVEGILILDDLAGFIGRRHYERFAHPFLKRICDAFPADWVKVLHNDASVAVCLEMIPEAGFDVLNWGVDTPMPQACQRLGGRVTLMGNVPPLEVGVRGTPEQVQASALRSLREAGDHPLILSFAGVTTTGTPPDNIRAMIRAWKEYAEQG